MSTNSHDQIDKDRIRQLDREVAEWAEELRRACRNEAIEGMPGDTPVYRAGDAGYDQGLWERYERPTAESEMRLEEQRTILRLILAHQQSAESVNRAAALLQQIADASPAPEDSLWDMDRGAGDMTAIVNARAALTRSLLLEARKVMEQATKGVEAAATGTDEELARAEAALAQAMRRESELLAEAWNQRGELEAIAVGADLNRSETASGIASAIEMAADYGYDYETGKRLSRPDYDLYRALVQNPTYAGGQSRVASTDDLELRMILEPGAAQRERLWKERQERRGPIGPASQSGPRR